MGGTAEFFVVLSCLGAIGGIMTPIGIWYLCAIVKRGVNQHVSTMDLIYEEIRKTNRPGSPLT